MQFGEELDSPFPVHVNCGSEISFASRILRCWAADYRHAEQDGVSIHVMPAFWDSDPSEFASLKSDAGSGDPRSGLNQEAINKILIGVIYSSVTSKTEVPT